MTSVTNKEAIAVLQQTSEVVRLRVSRYIGLVMGVDICQTEEEATHTHTHTHTQRTILNPSLLLTCESVILFPQEPNVQA
jgi:hypothetical protein